MLTGSFLSAPYSLKGTRPSDVSWSEVWKMKLNSVRLPSIRKGRGLKPSAIGAAFANRVDLGLIRNRVKVKWSVNTKVSWFTFKSVIWGFGKKNLRSRSEKSLPNVTRFHMLSSKSTMWKSFVNFQFVPRKKRSRKQLPISYKKPPELFCEYPKTCNWSPLMAHVGRLCNCFQVLIAFLDKPHICFGFHFRVYIT